MLAACKTLAKVKKGLEAYVRRSPHARFERIKQHNQDMILTT